MNFCLLRYFHNFFHNFLLGNHIIFILKFSFELRILNSSIGNIVLYSIVKKNAILRNYSNLVSQIWDLDLSNVLIINQNCALIHIVKSIEQSHNCRFSCPCRSDQSIWFARRNSEGDLVNDVRFILIWWILERNVSEFNLTKLHSTWFGIYRLWDLQIHVQKIKYLAHIDHLLSYRSPHRAQEV